MKGLALMLMGILAAGPALTGGHPVYGLRPERKGFSHLAHEHEDCGECHQAQQRRKRSSLKFSHRLHGEVPERCLHCHDPANESAALGMLPRADRCRACHQAFFENRRCDACHASLADGRLATRLENGTLLPRGGHGGQDHGPGWRDQHGGAARSLGENCRSCHTSRSCDGCHQGVLRDFEIHPAGWELSHPGPARAGLMDCDSCHRDQSGCLGCHRQAGVAESSEKRPRNMRLHPAGYEDNHAADARRNLRSCTACHAEGDCIRCHGAAGIGEGVRPHPAGFKQRCRLLRQRNPRPCAKCHTQGDLEARCP
jgi:hypothetical protein